MQARDAEVAVRRELARLGRRWAPVGVALTLVVAVLVTSHSGDQQVAASGDSKATIAPAGSPGTSSAEDVNGGHAGPSDAADSSNSGGLTGAGPSAGQAPATRAPHCDGTTRQLPGSAYGPLCAPPFSGDNGGATAFGVTGKTVTASFRIADSASLAALQAAAGDALDSLGANQEQVAADMATLVAFFNTQFELYGRHVELKTFKGQGDVLEEFQNRGAAGAQADAARAKDLGAFIDMSMVSQTQLYAEALVANGVISESPVFLSESWNQAHAPYTVSAIWPAVEHMGAFMATVVCTQMAGRNASLSTDPVTAAKPRVFGILHPENPEYAKTATVIQRGLSACGQKVARTVAYPLDVTTAAQSSTNAVAQLRAAGVTTVLCVCDHTSPIFLTKAADQQSYYPEYFSAAWPDPFPRLYSERQWRNAIYAGGSFPDVYELEPGKVFAMASGGAPPQAPLVLHWTYQQVLLLFAGLQSAGPGLTAATFYRGVQRLPATTDGAVGPWEFGARPAMARTHFQLGQWDGAATSKLDGKQGAIVSCRDGQWFRFDQAADIGAHDGLGCRVG